MTTTDPVRHAAAFHRLHVKGAGVVMPNAWDAGSAVILADAGFDAIASTSAGIAFSMARADHTLPQGAAPVSREAMFARVREIVDAVDMPVNGDLEAGYGDGPEAVADTIRLALDAGLAGGNIEDHAGGALYDVGLGVERIAAAREAIDGAGSAFVLTARTDGLLLREPTALADAIERANRYRQAGADCLYVPGVNDLDTIATLCREIDAPVNVVMGLGSSTLTVADLRAAGVARISLGGSIARAALGFVRQAAAELRDAGTMTFAATQIPQSELNTLFGGGRR
jgi:2-methylisocitrate lyase-like PEP mutase family enzyme